MPRREINDKSIYILVMILSISSLVLMTLALASKARSAVMVPTVSAIRSTLFVSVGFSESIGVPGVLEVVTALSWTPPAIAVCWAGI